MEALQNSKPANCLAWALTDFNGHQQYNLLSFGNLRDAAGFVSFNGAGVAGLNCQTFVANGTQSDIASGYHVMIIRNP